ncbi:hypothetical protein NL676_034826 [Syzygium grande]|nr:hypothetical protein NL676_034826 [Syzygium grande]
MLDGGDTKATTIEWSMILLLKHSEAMRRARDEIEFKVGHDRLLEESDLANLNYLQNVVSETRRLYLVDLLMLPHESLEDMTIRNFHVLRVVGLALGALLQCFEWRRVGLQEIDMTEGNSLTAPPLERLQALCKPQEMLTPFLAGGDDRFGEETMKKC